MNFCAPTRSVFILNSNVKVQNMPLKTKKPAKGGMFPNTSSASFLHTVIIIA